MELNTPSRYQNIKLSMISKAGEFPELKGRAAEIRHLGKPLLAVWNKHFHPGNREHRLVRLALQASVGIEDVLDVAQGDFVLGDAAANALREHCFNLMALATCLGNLYHPRHVKLFHYTIKCHYILHLGLMAKELNPRLGWCYAGEDWMQKAKVLLASCQKGTRPPEAINKALSKYCYGLTFNMMRRGDIWKE